MTHTRNNRWDGAMVSQAGGHEPHVHPQPRARSSEGFNEWMLWRKTADLFSVTHGDRDGPLKGSSREAASTLSLSQISGQVEPSEDEMDPS